MPTAVSLFTGCGGSDQGLKSLGFEVLMANDIMACASDVYRQNFPETKMICDDVSNIKEFPSADLLVGCYPCQGFSQGGVRKENRAINYLYREFDRALRTMKPKAFIVENVSGMLRSNFQHLLKNQVCRFRMAGYKVATPQILNACDYGVPQTRKRAFIVGIRSDFGLSYEFPKPTHGPEGQKDYISQKEALKGLPKWPTNEFYDKPFHWYYMSRNRRRSWDEPASTIVANARHMPLHPASPEMIKLGPDKWVFKDKGKPRRFSYKEAAILQGFPAKFKFPDKLNLMQKYTVIGNAVPPPLFAAVAKALPNIW